MTQIGKMFEQEKIEAINLDRRTNLYTFVQDGDMALDRAAKRAGLTPSQFDIVCAAVRLTRIRCLVRKVNCAASVLLLSRRNRRSPPPIIITRWMRCDRNLTLTQR